MRTLLTQKFCLMCHAQTLYLNRNQIGDPGMVKLSEALGNGALPNCTAINVDLNPASAEAKKALRDAIARRK